MSEKVVLPKFDLPGPVIHPAVRIAWATGILLFVAMLVLGGALWRRRSIQLAEEAERAAKEAAKIAAIEAKAKAAEDARLAALKPPAPPAGSKTLVASAEEGAGKGADGQSAGGGDPKGSTASRRKGKHRSSSKSKTVAKSSPSAPEKSTKKSTRDDAAIDRLLNQFK